MPQLTAARATSKSPHTSHKRSPIQLTPYINRKMKCFRRFITAIPETAHTCTAPVRAMPPSFQLAGPVSTPRSLRRICGGHTGTETSFSPSTSVFPLSMSFQQCPMVIHSTITDDIQSRQLTASLNNTLTDNSLFPCPVSTLHSSQTTRCSVLHVNNTLVHAKCVTR